MPIMTRVLPYQAARTMQVATRRGGKWYVTGSTGKTYRVTMHETYVGWQPGNDEIQDGQVVFECWSMDDNEPCPAMEYYWHSRGECKHARVVRRRMEME